MIPKTIFSVLLILLSLDSLTKVLTLLHLRVASYIKLSFITYIYIENYIKVEQDT